MQVVLNGWEIAELDKQDPATAHDGGFQSLMVSLQRKIDRTTGMLILTIPDIRRIQTYAFKYRNGGWQNRLLSAFRRHLGPQLGGAAS